MTIKIHYGVNYHREDNFKTIAIKQTTTLKEIKQLIREKEGISNEHTLIIKLDNSLLGNDEKNFPQALPDDAMLSVQDNYWQITVPTENSNVFSEKFYSSISIFVYILHQNTKAEIALPSCELKHFYRYESKTKQVTFSDETRPSDVNRLDVSSMCLCAENDRMQSIPWNQKDLGCWLIRLNELNKDVVWENIKLAIKKDQLWRAQMIIEPNQKNKQDIENFLLIYVYPYDKKKKIINSYEALLQLPTIKETMVEGFFLWDFNSCKFRSEDIFFLKHDSRTVFRNPFKGLVETFDHYKSARLLRSSLK